MSRSDTEVEAYRTGSHRKKRAGLRQKFSYIYNVPNSQRESDDFNALVAESALENAVLEVGCGTGWNCSRFLELGAAEVDGVDISPELLAEARAKHGNPNVRFYEHDIHQPFERSFDLVVGRAILHHVDYQRVLSTIYEHNLNPGGRMLFMEPLGSGLLMRLYWAVSGEFHTPDERPFFRRDINWLKQQFPGFRLRSYNLISLPIAALSMFVSREPNNALTRWADRADQWIAHRLPWTKPWGRSAIFEIVKPAVGGAGEISKIP